MVDSLQDSCWGCAMVAAGLGRESCPESAECHAEGLEFHPVFVLNGAPLLQRFWGWRLGGCRRRRACREPIHKESSWLDRVRCLNCHGAFGVATL